jgi:hypothetical protein
MYERALRENLPRVMDTVAAAAERVGRPSADVRIIAVTKGHPIEAVMAAVGAGLRTVGENRLAELAAKQETFGRDRCEWHMIGHLQSRKAVQVLGAVDLLHSLDTVRLAERLQRMHEEDPRTERLSVLAQVNSSGEESKGGIGVEGADDELGKILELPALDVRGLMTMAPWTEDEGVLRDAFRRLRELSERVRKADARLGPELSMGMSNDYGIAVEEGSTMVRIGTALLGERSR